MPTLFHKRSTCNMFGGQRDEGSPPRSHGRKVSLASSLASSTSRSSSESHRKPGSFDPLSLHPPLALNASPHFDEERYRDDAEREDRFFDRRASPRSEGHVQYSPESSPVKGENPYLRQGEGSARRISYFYDRAAQWPLKDWQTVPPGLADVDELGEPITVTPLAPRPVHPERRRRPTGGESPGSESEDPAAFFVRRGDWKRRGIVFHLGSDAEEEQERHFEIDDPFGVPN